VPFFCVNECLSKIYNIETEKKGIETQYLEKGVFKMNTWTIIEVVAEGFKNFKEKHIVSFTNGINGIEGENARGKTSLAECVVWVLTGRNLVGQSKDLNLITEGESQAFGQVTLTNEFGEHLIVERKLQQSVTIKINGKRSTQKELEKFIPSEAFLLQFNPMYFLDLDADNGRRIVTDLLPEVKKEEVLDKLSTTDREVLEKQVFEMEEVADFIKFRRQDVVKIDEKITRLEGSVSKLQDYPAIPEVVVFDETPLQKLKETLQEVMKRKPILQEITALTENKIRLETIIAQIKKETFDEGKELKLLKDKKEHILSQIQVIQKAKFVPVSTHEMQAKVNLLRSQAVMIQTSCKEVNAQVKHKEGASLGLKAGENCPVCHQSITEEAIAPIQKELEKRIELETTPLKEQLAEKTKTYNELIIEGKGLVETLEKMNKEELELKEKFEKEQQSQIEVLQNGLSTVYEELKNVTEKANNFEKDKGIRIEKIQLEIKQLGIEEIVQTNAKLEIEFKEKQTQEENLIRKSISELEAKKVEAIQSIAKKEQVEAQIQKQKDDLKKAETMYQEYKSKKDDLENLIRIMKKFQTEKTGLIHHLLSTHLNRVSIRLEKVTASTGEVKNVFEVLYDNKQLKVCSFSETVRAGLEIVHMMQKLSQTAFPVFIDNKESITSFDWNPNLQLIQATVKKGASLTITHNGHTENIESVA